MIERRNYELFCILDGIVKSVKSNCIVPNGKFAAEVTTHKETLKNTQLHQEQPTMTGQG